MSRRKVVIIGYDQFMRMTQGTNLKPESPDKEITQHPENILEKKKAMKSSLLNSEKVNKSGNINENSISRKKTIKKKKNPDLLALNANEDKISGELATLKSGEKSIGPPPPGLPNQVGGSEIKKSDLFNFNSPVKNLKRKSQTDSISEIVKHWKE